MEIKTSTEKDASDSNAEENEEQVLAKTRKEKVEKYVFYHLATFD